MPSSGFILPNLKYLFRVFGFKCVPSLKKKKKVYLTQGRLDLCVAPSGHSVRNAELQALSQTYWTRTCILTRAPGDSQVHSNSRITSLH